MTTRKRTRTAVLALLAAFIVAALPAGLRAQSLTWNDISGKPGFSTLSGLSDGTLFGINGGTLYRSTDDGENWFAIPRPGGTILDFVARGSTTVIAIGNFNVPNYKQISVSSDRGDSWTRVYTEGSSGPVHTNIMLSPDETIYALHPSGSRIVFEKFDGGVWQQVGNAPQVYYVAAAEITYSVSDIDASGALYIGTLSDGIHSSRDNGQSWTRALPYRNVSAIAFSPTGRAAIATLPNGRTAGGVFTSDDHGATWDFVDLTDIFIGVLTFNAGGDLFAVAEEGIYRRRAGSEEWETVGPFDFTYSFLKITPSGKYISTAEGLGLLVSTDAGENWETDGVRQQDLYSVASTPDGTMLAGTLGKGVFRSTDRGVTWVQLQSPGGPAYFYTLTTVEGRTYAGTERGLFASDDEGLHWSLLTASLNSDSVDISVFTFVRSAGGDLYIGTGAGVWRSVDGGISWFPAGLASYSVRSLANRAEELYAATLSAGVFRSTNGGSSWTSRGLVRPDIQTIAVNDAGVVYTGVSGGVYYSTNAGATWTGRIFTTGHVYAFLFNGNFDTYAASGTGVFGSSNGGESWGGRGLNNQFVIALSYDLNHSMLAAVYRGGVYRTFEIITGADEPAGLPSAASLARNYPNPFNPVTTISYDIASSSGVELEVFDLLGRMVETLVSGPAAPGHYEARWDASGFPSGVYVYRIRITPDRSAAGPGAIPAYEATGKMLLLR